MKIACICIAEQTFSFSTTYPLNCIINTVTADSGLRYKFVIRTITRRSGDFSRYRAQGQATGTYIVREILDITFRLLSTCSAARNRHMQQVRFFRAYHLAGLYEYIVLQPYPHFPSHTMYQSIQLHARAKAGKKPQRT